MDLCCFGFLTSKGHDSDFFLIEILKIYLFLPDLLAHLRKVDAENVGVVLPGYVDL